MLAADKLQLQSSLKQQATALKEKEFNLHHSNLMTVGTQAAVLASLDITMLVEFTAPSDTEWGWAYPIPRLLKFFYYIAITSAFCANILVVSQTTLLSLLGSSLALRGPDGSMITATDGLYEERKIVYSAFTLGLISTVGSVVLLVWLLLRPEAALVCMSVTIITGFKMYSDFLRISNKFKFDESETVDFTDIFEGPAAITAMPQRFLSTRKRKDDDYYSGNESDYEIAGRQRRPTSRQPLEIERRNARSVERSKSPTPANIKRSSSQITII